MDGTPRQPGPGRAGALYQAIRERPGIHFRALGRASGLRSAGQLRHHLDGLRRAGLVVELADGRYRRYLVTADADAGLRSCLSHFARPHARRIAASLVRRPMRRRDLQRHLGCADSTLGYHLRRLLEMGDLERRWQGGVLHYDLTDPETVRRMLRLPPGGDHGGPSGTGLRNRREALLAAPATGPTLPDAGPVASP
jgi:DNA-binding transcriptional ArsR family regulator